MFCLVITVSQFSWGVDKTQRLGVGVKADPIAPAALVLHYYQSQQFSWWGTLGAQSEKGFHLSAAWRYHWLQESQWNTFWALQVRHWQDSGPHKSDALAMGAFLGIEYFLATDFSIHWDVGIEILSQNQKTQWQTGGSPLTQIALTFYL